MCIRNRYYPVEKVKKEYGSNESMLYMPIVNLWDKEAVATIQTFIKNFTPIAYELCFKDDANPVSYTHLDVYKRQI